MLKKRVLGCHFPLFAEAVGNDLGCRLLFDSSAKAGVVINLSLSLGDLVACQLVSSATPPRLSARQCLFL